MTLRWLRTSAAALLTASRVLAQFPSTRDDTIVQEFDDYSISYKQTTICETNARAWAGYVHMPGPYIGDIIPENATISLFFWYFEARNKPQDAPVAIYFAGGPGQSSEYGATWDGGPCFVTPDSNGTEENPWSWNEHVNMLYIDQPVGSGYSYAEILESTFNLLGATGPETVPFSAYGDEVPEQNATLRYGVFPSQDPSLTPNTTQAAVRTLWSFAQAWFADFPEYKTCDKRISIWGNSYGGYWAPASAAYFLKQNEKIAAGDIDGTILHVDQIGLANGAVDLLYQAEWYPQMAYNNTYGLEIINETVYGVALNNFHKPKGCAAKIQRCRELGAELDPEELGSSEKVNAACMKAQTYCTNNVAGAYMAYSLVEPVSLLITGLRNLRISSHPTQRSAFDIAQHLPDPFPQPYLSGFFNRDWVQRDLGVPLNFTALNLASMANMISTTGDSFRRAGMKDIEYLLSRDFKVTLMYGDRDYRCPWIGAEKLSLAAEWEGKERYAESGYEEIRVNDSYVGGIVRQYGGLSFSRVFQAGHHGEHPFIVLHNCPIVTNPPPTTVASYQPPTAHQIFTRSVFNLDIATGQHPTSSSPSHSSWHPHWHSAQPASENISDYSTSGPLDGYLWKQEIAPTLPTECNIYDIVATCTQDQADAYINGTAVVEGYVVVSPGPGGGLVGDGSLI